MRRWLLMLCGLLLASWLSPVKGTDVGELRPVELLQVYRKGDKVIMSTDTGDVGTGTTLKAAWKNLKETTPGAIFLETADYLLLTVETEELLSELSRLLRPGAEVCLVERAVDEKEATAWLAAHPPGVPLRSVRYGGKTAPLLCLTEGRFTIVK